MPFGLCDAAQRMCRLMDKVVPSALREQVFVYLDDLLNYAQTASPHKDCLKKDRVKKFELSEAAVQAFESLKTDMAAAPVLVTTDFKKPFIIQCDASTTGAFDFTIEHRRGSLNVVPDALSRVHMDAIQKVQVTAPDLHIELKSPFFQAPEYLALKEAAEANADKCPDIQTFEEYVYKRIGFCQNDAINNDRAWKLWVPAELRSQLTWRAHHAMTAAHGGLHKSLAKLRQFYYWPGMSADVQELVKVCEVCKVSKTAIKIKRPPMGEQRVTERAGQRLFIDFMGPYPRTKAGNSVIFVCLDHFSKFVRLHPMKQAVATEVVKFLEVNIFHQFDVPEVIHSDNGKQFVSQTFADLMDRYGINHIRTGLYSPQANAAEREIVDIGRRNVLANVLELVETPPQSADTACRHDRSDPLVYRQVS
ncbi:uncharacterized protein K02A2.6-like [Drosophila teissieri]|uniref:uncharacterized protein K02A2.6-like n=1 Tax=Drosophila teissieri TaxID=7243 RepID=UPI001CBA56A7|nr:uncharacterized protein K02A2.6-like [Drosophila teissieri]